MPFNLLLSSHSIVFVVIVFVLKMFSNNNNTNDKQNIIEDNTSESTPNDNDYVQPGAPATPYGVRAQQSGYDIIDPPNSTQY
jgi:hypothetical protein